MTSGTGDFACPRLRADDAGDFAHVRAGLATRQRLYFDDYLSSLRGATPDADEERLRMLTSRHVSPPLTPVATRRLRGGPPARDHGRNSRA